MGPSLVQITDPHVGATWTDTDPLQTLRAVVAAVLALPERPLAALVTGDLASSGAEEEYRRLGPVLAELELPLLVLPGNHDDRAGLRRAFELPGEAAEPIQYAVELEGLRVLMLDTVRPGEDDGELGPARLGWIAGELAAHPALPTLLAMHHPPFACGIRGMDRLALAAADRDALAALLREHPQVCGVVAGHVHRTMATALAGRPATAIPGTYGQFPLQFDDPGLRVVAEPLAFAVHALVDGRLVSHVQTLPRTA